MTRAKPPRRKGLRIKKPITLFLCVSASLRDAAKYRVEAAIKADFSGIYLDAEQYALMEKGPEWKLNRLRFTVAHELAHYFLHRDLPQASDFASLTDFARWTANYSGRKYAAEQE